MSSPPTSNNRRTRKLLGQPFPDKPLNRLLLGTVGTVGSLGIGTYGVNFMLGPLNFGVLEFLWGALLAVGGIAGTFASVLVLVTTLYLTLSERSSENRTTSSADDDPVESLKRRYAEGEVSDEEFERQLDQLLQHPDRDGSRHWTETEEATTDRDKEMSFDH